MTLTALGWFIAGIFATAFITLWFYVSFRELSEKRKSLDAIREQVQFHQRLCIQAHDGENATAAQNMLENNLLVYCKVEKDYNALLKRPTFCLPAYIMGFHLSEKKD